MNRRKRLEKTGPFAGRTCPWQEKTCNQAHSLGKSGHRSTETTGTASNSSDLLMKRTHQEARLSGGFSCLCGVFFLCVWLTYDEYGAGESRQPTMGSLADRCRTSKCENCGWVREAMSACQLTGTAPGVSAPVDGPRTSMFGCGWTGAAASVRAVPRESIFRHLASRSGSG